MLRPTLPLYLGGTAQVIETPAGTESDPLRSIRPCPAMNTFAMATPPPPVEGGQDYIRFGAERKLDLGRFDFLVAPQFAWEPHRAAFRDLTVPVSGRSGHTPQREEAEIFDSGLLGWIVRTDPHRAA